MKKILLLIALCTAQISWAQVWVYDYPDTLVYTEALGRNYRSSVYDVKVVQNGKIYDSYVMADYNTFPLHHGARRLMTEWNHFTTFSFKGNIEIVITKKDRSTIGECGLYPKIKNIPYKVTGDQVTITIGQPQKMYLEMEGMEDDPLFIFADPDENDIPDMRDHKVGVVKVGMPVDEVRELLKNTSYNTIIFEKGIHKYGVETDLNYPGYQLPVVSNKEIYIPGGTYIVGSFRGSGVNNVKIHGRGIISGCGKERLAQAKSIPYNQIQLDGEGENQIVEGLTFTNAPHFVLLSRGKIKAHNLKMFAWYHQTDGFGGGKGSEITNTFMKVNDDFVKIYKDDQKASEMFFYKQINGALFQFGWGSYGAAHNVQVSDIYVMKDADKYPKKANNTAVINLVNNKGSHIGNCTFENFYIDQNVQRLLGIKLNGGSMKNITLRNMHINGKNNVFNYLYALEGGAIENIILEDVYVGGIKVKNSNAFGLEVQGEVKGVKYK